MDEIPEYVANAMPMPRVPQITSALPEDKSCHWLVLTSYPGKRPHRARRFTVLRRGVEPWLTQPTRAASSRNPIRKALYTIWIDARDLAKISTIKNAVSTVQLNYSLTCKPRCRGRLTF